VALAVVVEKENRAAIYELDGFFCFSDYARLKKGQPALDVQARYGVPDRGTDGQDVYVGPGRRERRERRADCCGEHSGSGAMAQSASAPRTPAS
jgi:hypothetical protein